MLWLPLIFVLAYLLGSLPAGLLAGRLRGQGDLRARGSGSTGATNVVRLAGWGPGLVVLAVDVGKGFAAVWLLSRIRPTIPAGGDEVARVVAGMGAICGHVWPAFSGFRGGKGVATTAGAMLALHPPALGVAVAVFAIVLAATRIVSLGSIAAAVALPGALWLARIAGWPPEVPMLLLAFGFAAAAVIVVAHRTNVARWLAGHEPPLGGG